MILGVIHNKNYQLFKYFSKLTSCWHKSLNTDCACHAKLWAIMFEDFLNPAGKKKGKEKDVGKRRAYVRVVTSLGGGSLNLELYCEKVCFLLRVDIHLCSDILVFCRRRKRVTIF